jgi:hypothetical protein
MPLFFVLCALVATACSAKSFYGREIEPYGQLQEMQRKIDDKQYEYGHLMHGVSDGGELAEAPDGVPRGGVDAATFTFVRLEGDQICFETRSKPGTEDERRKEADRYRTTFSYFVAAHASLDEWKPDAPWPTSGKYALTKIAQRKSTGRDRFDHESEPDYEGSPTVELCGLAPPITDQTNFLTLAVVHKEKSRESYLLVWDFKGKRR